MFNILKSDLKFRKTLDGILISDIMARKYTNKPGTVCVTVTFIFTQRSSVCIPTHPPAHTHTLKAGRRLRVKTQGHRRMS